jgi:hypothetical protein
MSRRQPDFSRPAERLQAYLDGLTQVAGHADRIVPIENYTKGLMLPIERKSVESMAARLAPGNVRQMQRSLHHIVADAAWSDDALLKQVRLQVLPAMTRNHVLAAWIVDATGFPKKGSHSVGVTRQYCGQLGKQENCRAAVSVSLATEQASIPAAYPHRISGDIPNCGIWSCNLLKNNDIPESFQHFMGIGDHSETGSRHEKWKRKIQLCPDIGDIFPMAVTANVSGEFLWPDGTHASALHSGSKIVRNGVRRKGANM